MTGREASRPAVDEWLARGARTALAAGSHGWLGPPGRPGACGARTGLGTGRAPDAVRVHDDDGEPVLSAPDGRLHALPACLLALTVAATPGLLRLRLVGRVRPCGRGAVRMAVERVVVGCPRAGLGRESDVDLDAYAQAWPDEVLAHGPALAAGLARSRAAELRGLGARRTGCDPADVAAVTPARVDHDALWLDVLTVQGGARLAVPFARRVHTAPQLAAALHDLLG